jgi:hypothetical protein
MPEQLKSQRFQNAREKRCLLETVSAAMISNDFLLHTVQIDSHAAPEQYVKILKRDVARVCQEDRR